jgi:aryl-alcohol dehydrogenase-like predicted oxidoreductase
MAPVNLRRINEMLVSTARPIAASHGATLSQLSLAWALSQPGVTDVVAGATTEQQAIENAETMRLASPPEDLRKLEAGLAACNLDPSPRPPLTRRLRSEAARIRSLGGRVLRRLGLR